MHTKHMRASLASLVSLLSVTQINAQQVLDALSFGHKSPLSIDHLNIPNFRLNSEGHSPSILSDRVILTPPNPGHVRAALWSDTQLNADSFNIDLELRANGPERGSGNLQLWLSRDTSPTTGLRSIYTVERFEGLALVLDQYGGGGGTVRGFLNDGSVDYKGHHNVDSLAFGHCDFRYRNLGRWSRLSLRQDNDGFVVSVDGQTCFSSNNIKLPSGYYVGLSAASAETPDSFELSKLVVASGSSGFSQQYQQPPPPSGNNNAFRQAPPPSGNGFDTSAQYNELLNRLQTMYSSLETTYNEISALSHLQLERHKEIKASVGNIPAVPQSQLQAMDRRIQSIEQTVQKIQRDIEGRDYQDTLTGLQKALKDTQADLMSSLPQSMSQIVNTSAPKMWLFILVVLVFQAALAGSYIVYKRRRSNSPKKLL